MRRPFIPLLVLAASLASPVCEAQSPGSEVQSPAVADAVYQAVIRYQIKNWTLGADSYCIEILGKDADQQLLRTLRPLPVKPASDCVKQKKKFDMLVVDKHSKKSSVIFGAGDIHWVKETQADVDGGYLCGSQCMAAGVYHVIRDGQQWQVSKFDVRLGY